MARRRRRKKSWVELHQKLGRTIGDMNLEYQQKSMGHFKPISPAKLGIWWGIADYLMECIKLYDLADEEYLSVDNYTNETTVAELLDNYRPKYERMYFAIERIITISSSTLKRSADFPEGMHEFIPPTDNFYLQAMMTHFIQGKTLESWMRVFMSKCTRDQWNKQSQKLFNKEVVDVIKAFAAMTFNILAKECRVENDENMFRLRVTKKLAEGLGCEFKVEVPISNSSESGGTGRADSILYSQGHPIAVLEFKRPSVGISEQHRGVKQLKRYMRASGITLGILIASESKHNWQFFEMSNGEVVSVAYEDFSFTLYK